MMKKARWAGFLIVSLYVAGIVSACLMNFSSGKVAIPDTLFGIPGDKAAHFIMFLPFSPLVYTYIFRYEKFQRKPRSQSVNKDSVLRRNAVIRIICTFTSGAAFGGLIEIMQLLLTSGRSAEWADWIADLCGLSAGFALIWPFKRTSDAMLRKWEKSRLKQDSIAT